MSKLVITDEFKRVKALLDQNAGPIFATGKAGTGKSTLINWIKSSYKSVALSSTTASSALHIGGSTAHSLFSIGVDGEIGNLKPLSKDRRTVFQNTDLFVIDEIGMMPPNVVGCVDARLRGALDPEVPFGGARVLVSGDLLQIPTVLGNRKEEILSRFRTSFFFSSPSFDQCHLNVVELNEVFRQENREMVEHLGAIREGVDYREALKYFNNKCYLDKKGLPKDDDCLRLVSTNSQCDQINEERLAKLNSKLHIFVASKSGSYNNITSEKSKSRLPAPEVLNVKVGARIVFIKNGISYFNGSTATVVSIDSEAKKVIVKMDSDGREEEIEPITWNDNQYVTNPKTLVVETVSVGSYIQFPFQLGWALTLHKAQGMSLDKVRVDFSGGVFDSGMVYVGLSRCKAPEGLTLDSPISMKMVWADQNAMAFYRAIREGRNWREADYVNPYYFPQPVRHERLTRPSSMGQNKLF